MTNFMSGYSLLYIYSITYVYGLFYNTFMVQCKAVDQTTVQWGTMYSDGPVNCTFMVQFTELGQSTLHLWYSVF